MVDMQARNTKLRARTVRMLRGRTNCSAAEAHSALDATGGKVELAVRIVGGMQPTEAEALLARHHGSLRSALVNDRGHSVRMR
jgi:N-acetylmuramic acid 6-phosphate etherase